MKSGKKPTLKQKKAITEAGLNVENWLVSKSLEDRLVLTHRFLGTEKTIFI